MRRSDYRKRAATLGFDDVEIGTEFRSGSRTFRVVGVSTSASHRYCPIRVEQIDPPDSSTFYVSPRTVRTALAVGSSA